MKFRFVVLSIFLLIPAFVPAQFTAQQLTQPTVDGASYIGYKYVGVRYNKKLPNGVRDLGGSLLENEEFGVSRMKKGSTEMLWLARITGRNSRGVPNWEVQDVLTLPVLQKNEQILQGFQSSCTIEDEESLDLIVLARFVAAEKIFKVEKAWRADTLTGKFQEVVSETVSCDFDESEDN